MSFFRKRWKLTLLVVILFSGFLGLLFWPTDEVSEEERESLRILGMNGWVSRSTSGSRLSSLLHRFQPIARLMGEEERSLISFVPEKLTDPMVDHMLRVRSLVRITVYPSDPVEQKIDYQATDLSPVVSLRGMGLTLSETSLSRLEQRTPKLNFYVAKRPATSAETPGGNPILPKVK